jgi:hypothetical protein
MDLHFFDVRCGLLPSSAGILVMRSPDMFTLYCPLQWNTCVADTPRPHAKTAFRGPLLLKTVIVSSEFGCFKKVKFRDCRCAKLEPLPCPAACPYRHPAMVVMTRYLLSALILFSIAAPQFQRPQTIGPLPPITKKCVSGPLRMGLSVCDPAGR